MNMLLPGYAGGGDLPADDVLTGQLREFELDRIALGTRSRAAMLRQFGQARRLPPVLQQHGCGVAGILRIHVLSS